MRNGGRWVGRERLMGIGGWEERVISMVSMLSMRVVQSTLPRKFLLRLRWPSFSPISLC